MNTEPTQTSLIDEDRPTARVIIDWLRANRGWHTSESIGTHSGIPNPATVSSVLTGLTRATAVIDGGPGVYRTATRPALYTWRDERPMPPHGTRLKEMTGKLTRRELPYLGHLGVEPGSVTVQLDGDGRMASRRHYNPYVDDASPSEAPAAPSTAEPDPVVPFEKRTFWSVGDGLVSDGPHVYRLVRIETVTPEV